MKNSLIFESVSDLIKNNLFIVDWEIKIVYYWIRMVPRYYIRVSSVK